MDEVASTASKEDKTEQQTKSHTTVESGSANGPQNFGEKSFSRRRPHPGQAALAGRVPRKQCFDVGQR